MFNRIGRFESFDKSPSVHPWVIMGFEILGSSLTIAKLARRPRTFSITLGRGRPRRPDP